MTGHKFTIDPKAMYDFGKSVDFGQSANDYATHRAGFPPAFFDFLIARNYARPGQRALDLGTGTGTIARGLARIGLEVTGIDPARPLLDEAKRLDRKAGVQINYLQGCAEETDAPDQYYDLITAGQC